MNTKILQMQNAYFYETHYATEANIARDAELFEERMAKLDQCPEMRVGDFLKLRDGSIARVAHNWGDGVQPSTSEKGGSFYLGGGYVSYSGSLNSLIPIEEFRLKQELCPGRVWLFHRDQSGAGRGVSADMMFRVYEQIQ